MTLLDNLIAEADKFLDPIRGVVSNPPAINRLLGEIGTNRQDAGGDRLVNALSTIVTLATDLDNLSSEDSPSFADIAAALAATRKMVQAIEALEASGAKAALEGFGRDLLDLLIVAYLGHWHQVTREVATLLTLIEPAEAQQMPAASADGNGVVRNPFVIDRVHLERLPALIRDPVGTLRAYYWNDLQTEADADAIAGKLFVRIRNLLRELKVSCRYGINTQDVLLFGDETPLVDHALVIYSENELGGADVDAGITVTLSPADHGDLGLVISPFGTIAEQVQAGPWQVEFQLGAQIQAFAVGRRGLTVLASLDTTEIDAAVTATLPSPANGPAFVLGSPTGSRLEIGGAVIGLQAALTEATQTLALSGEVSKSTIVISAGDGDGFLSSILPKDGLQTKFDLGIAWSNERGLTFKGAAGLDATLPVGICIADVITLPSVHLGLQVGDAGLVAEVSISVGVLIGPVKAVADRIGIQANITFPQTGANLGFADLAFVFKPPSGVGLSIDSAGVSGGGFLAHDDAKLEYSGVLELQFDSLALQAFGLITTQVAGGEGYSLLALIDADFPPVQLGWGFSLDGVGGLVAVHRTASVDALRAAMKAGTLSTIMFPTSSITNAPLVLAQLDTLFPTAPGRFLFGPMALIGWGTPVLITASVAVILELPEPIRIILLAVIQARLPTPSNPLVRLTMDALGVLDLGQDEFSLDATLYDSKLITYAISGDMALRANWGAQNEFLLAVGGFHPSFSPPPDFPALKRMAIDMSSGSVTKLRLAAYLAVTANSVQFGARLDVAIGASGYGLSGHLGFDALLQMHPFHFEADISGAVVLTAGGDDLLSVSLDATLTGPAPWNIAGKLKLHIIFFDVHVSFSQSWGLDAPSEPVPSIDVGALLGAALADPRNWNSSMPAGSSALVVTRQVEDPTAVFAHPLAQLGVQERIVPLGLAITRFGEATLAGANEFAITDFRIGSGAPPYTVVQDSFAPAQFFDLSDTDKLSRPSFELHDSGVLMSGGLVTNGSALAKTIDYETFFIDTPGAIRVDEGVPQPFPWSVIEAVLLTGPAARKTISRAGHRRYTAPGNPITVAEPAFAVVDTTALNPQGTASPGKTTYSDATAMLTGLLAASPHKRGSLQIIATHELESA